MGVLTYRSADISGTDPDICIDLVEGYLIPVDVRGEDWVVPRLDGRQAGNRRKDRLILPLAGIVRGTGTDRDSMREDFHANVLALMAVMDPELDPGALVLSDGYLGLGAGLTASIDARLLNASPGRVEGWHTGQVRQRWTFNLEAIDPEWVYGT